MENDTVASAKDLAKTFDLGLGRNRAFAAVSGISFRVRRNTLFGFLGPNGAGKTTTIKMMTGLIFPTRGQIELFGEAPASRSARARVGYLPENPSFPDHLTGSELLRFAARLQALPSQRARSEIDRVLTAVDLKRAEKVQIRKYSKGMVQRLGIAQALLGEPEFVILDEPMSGLDPIGRREIKDLILELRRQGKTVFFSTHIISDVEEICDDVAIVVNGKLARQGRVIELIDSASRDMEITVRGLPPDFDGTTERSGEVASIVVRGETELRNAMERIWAANATVSGVRPRRYGLEEIFLQEVRREPGSARAGDQQ